MSAMQLDLYVNARHSDPASSAMADADQRDSGKRQRNLDRVLSLIAAHPGMTTRELSALSEWDRYEIARRTSDLKRLGLATHSPRPRQCHAGGRPAVAWMLTTQGRAAL